MNTLQLVALLVSLAQQQQIDPVPVPGTPHLIGTPVALGDLDNPPNGLDAGDFVLSDEGERARDTYGFAVLDASNGFEKVMADLAAIHPELGHFAALAVVEGSLMLFDPPLHVPLLQGQTRRIIRGSGGLRLYLTHDGEDEIEDSNFAVLGGFLQEQRKFQPHAGLLQTAESLSADQPAKWSALQDILPPIDVSVRQVCAYLGVDGYPWIAVGCSVVKSTEIDPADQADALAAQTSRLLRWNPGTLRFDDVTSTNLVGVNPVETWGVASADLNNDTYPDLVFGRYGWDFHGALNQIFLGDGHGVMTALPDADGPFVNSGFDPTTDVVVADLDADGFQDIVVANAWVHRKSAISPSRNYVFWGQAPSGTTAQGLPIPRYSAAPFYLDGFTEPFGPRDTVALDVADADGDGVLDIVAGNHGSIGAPFVPDGYLTAECGQPPLGDVLYDVNVSGGVRSVTPYDLESPLGDPHIATADIRFVDVVSPVRVAQPAAGGQKWDFSRVMVHRVGPNGDDPWEGVDNRDGFPEIVRVARGRSGSRLEWFLNDPLAKTETVTTYAGATSQAFVTSFDSYFDDVGGGSYALRNTYLSQGSELTLPSLTPLYAWRFLRLFGDPRSPQTGLELGCWALRRNPPTTPMRPSPIIGRLEQFDRLNELTLSAYANTMAFADFVPDRAWMPGVYERGVDWPSPQGLPDLLLGLGYELSGLPNRMIPFCSSSEEVQRIEGGELPGYHDSSGRGYSWTAGWTEKTNKGYGNDLVDVDNDGDLDDVASNRVDGVLFVNQGTPATPNGREGQFVRVKDQSVWPETGIPYAHSICFAEDNSSADFDEDGDLDVFLVGMVGSYDYVHQHSRGQRDEDGSGDSWFESMPNGERYLNDAHYFENQTIGQGPDGGFVNRGELLNINGRAAQGIGGDRVFPGDFDADGRMDALEAMWASLPPGTPGYTISPLDPTSNMWGPPPLLDAITVHKALAVRMWMNRPAPPSLPGAPLEFVDEGATRLLCKTRGGVVHFGTLDGLGGQDYQAGTQHTELHLRNWLSTAVGDLNNDGQLDFIGVYSPLATGTQGYDVFLNDGTGVLWNLPKDGELALGGGVIPAGTSIPPYAHADLAGPGGPQNVGSFSTLITDQDLDGDLDVFMSFFSILQKTALLENKFSSASVPANPYDPSLPGARLVPRPRTYAGPGTGWLEGEQHTFEYELIPGGGSFADFTTWIGSIDLDLDGDPDVAQVENGPGHRFYLNHSGDAGAAYTAMEDRSGDFGAGYQCSPPELPDLAGIFWNTRITAHNSALPVDFDSGDLNGDGLPDLFVNYDSRPANVYFNDGVRGENAAVGFDAEAALISRVWPPSGVKRGEKLRIYGLKMVNVRYVQLLLGPDAAGPQPTVVILSTTPGAITSYPHQRFIDVVVPTTAGHGPAAIVVGRRKNATTVVPSPAYRSQAFAVIP